MKRETSEETESLGRDAKKSRPSASIIGISRAISACQRCRKKKIKCDQNFPNCLRCKKAGVECVGLDPATGREVPRSYVTHLEDRIASLEGLLRKNGVEMDDSLENESGNLKILPETRDLEIDGESSNSAAIPSISMSGVSVPEGGPVPREDESKEETSYSENNMHNIMEGVTNVTRRSGSKAPPGYLNTSDGISFAKLMFAAVKVNQKNSRQSTAPPVPQIKREPGDEERVNVQSMSQDISSSTGPSRTPGPSLASLSIDPSVYLKHDVLPAILPPKKTAQEFIKIFFAQSNSQLPILHREEFVRTCFVPIYGTLDAGISLASNYTAINTDQCRGKEETDPSTTWFSKYKQEFQAYIQEHPEEKIDPVKISNNITPPAKFHRALYFLNIVFAISSSVHHLQYPATISDSFKAAAVKYIEPVYSSSDQLESLQGILLLALYSIMRPAVPGVWYVLGSALRLVVDLGLHSENDTGRTNGGTSTQTNFDSFTRDKRRRLFWCTYSLDRQICFYLGRPVGIPEESIRVPFPSELDDALIIPHDDSTPDYSQNSSGMPTYKVISLSFFRIRQIQSEVQKILYENSELPRKYNNLEDWKLQIGEKLAYWKNQAPKTQRKMNCDFNLEFFNLNYNHTLIMLHGISPKNYILSVQDFHRVSEASKELIHCYHQLYLSKSINYTWAAVHNLFMAGSSYLYTVYNSHDVRERNSFYEVKKVTQEGITVLKSLSDRCDAANHCREIFEVLTAAILKIRYNETVQGLTNAIPSTQQIARSQPAGHVNSNLQQLVENLSNGETSRSHQSSPQQNSNQQSLGNSPQQNSQRVQQNYPTHSAPSVQHKFRLNPFGSPNGLNGFNMASTASVESQNSIAPGTSVPTEPAGGPTQSPSTFEWITDRSLQTTTDAIGRQPTQYDLDIFFGELDNLSSWDNTSMGSKRSSVSENVSTDNSNSNSNQSALSHSNDIYHPSETPESSSSHKYTSSQRSSASGGATGGSSHEDGRTVPPTEAIRIYELIHQMPTESIWDQFFTAPLNNNTTFPN
ncbi:pyrimidine pathway regulatory protein 1 [[Candida] anglica]|uniref:Pyrimidine pathway regulatory protein 1 n=1 Tax=[Candida] anglica TaxID=148631 RepID=A0ABP0ELM2_9ASCO